jgi:heme-degrading monooxygenase HmoA
MIFVSVTRLRVRSLFVLPQFVWRAFQSVRQTERSPGFLTGRVLRETRNTFWTITAWNGAEAMNAFRVSGAHRAAMPSLIDWCDEASVMHWMQETAQLPSWAEAHRRMVAEGRQSKVGHPSPGQLANHIPEPHPGRIEAELKPAKSQSAR